MPAYDRTPLRMRQRLEGLIGSPGHLIGGFVDTMYLPGALRADFLDVLAIFLQTECFLEIVSLNQFRISALTPGSDSSHSNASDITTGRGHRIPRSLAHR